MTSIKTAMRALNVQLPRVAAISGDAEILATQEVKTGLDTGVLSKPQRDLLARAISDSSNKVTSIKARLGIYQEAFIKGDSNGDGRIDRQERKAATEALRHWELVNGSPDATAAQKAEAFKSVITTTHTMPNGTKREIAVANVGSLFEKLDALTK